MTRQRSFSVLLAVGLALLSVDIALRLSPQEAMAQEPQVWAGPGRPAPRIVATAAAGKGATWSFLVRISSDGFAEYRAEWNSLALPQQWTPLPDNPQAPLSRPVAVSALWAGAEPLVVYRQWANGTVDWLPITHHHMGKVIEFLPDPVWRTEPQ